MTTNDPGMPRPALPPLSGLRPEAVREPASTSPAEAAVTGDPAWVRPAVLALLGLTALLYLWGLGASGWANDFYSAAAQAGS